MKLIIFKKNDPTIKAEYNNVLTADVITVNSEIGVVNMTFSDGANAGKEYDPTEYAVRLNEE